MHDYDTLVIGSGIGGLTAGLALAQAGERVLVLEQHYLPGGWCHSFNLGGYQFSPGVHYIGQLGEGGMMRRLFEGLGLGDDLEFFELNPDGYDHVRIGEDRFDIPKGKARYRERLTGRFPGEAQSIRRYLDTVHDLARELDRLAEVRGMGDIVRHASRFRTVLRHGLSSLDGLLDHCGVRDPLLRGILSIQAGDHGVAPSRAPAALHAAIAAHYFEGGWYPKGGGRALPKAYIKALRRHGGEVRVKTAVERILTEKRGRRLEAVGVRLADGTELRARRVVSNADPHVTFTRLLDPADLSLPLRARLSVTKYSVGALSLFLAADIDARGLGLDSGNYWLSSTRRVEDAYDFGKTLAPGAAGDMPGLFLTVTTLKDPTKRTGGPHTMEAFTFVDWKHFQRWKDSEYGHRPEDYDRFKADLTARMLSRLETVVPGLSKKVVFSSLGTPLTNRYYVAATEGSIYGIEKSRLQVGPFSYPVKTEVKNLWMCGASTISHGVAGAAMSGLAVASRVLRASIPELLGQKSGPIVCRPAEPAATEERRVA